MRLAVVGEDRQEEDGVGVDMQGMQLILAEDGKEELREGRTRPAMTAFMKRG